MFFHGAGDQTQGPAPTTELHPQLRKSIFLYIKNICSQAWWLLPVIRATQEAEIRRIVVWSQPRQIVLETLSQKTFHKKGLVKWLNV
jgi:hypothetical protein